MDKLREAIDRELSSVTLDSIDRKFPEALPDRKENKMKISRKFAAIGAAAAVTAAALTITAGAVNDWDYGRAFRAFFPFSEEEKIEPVRGFMSEIPAECVTNTFTNYDVSVDGMIFDGYALMVSATLRSKDGTPFDKNVHYQTNFNSDFMGKPLYMGTPRIPLRRGITNTEVNDDGTLSLRSQLYFSERVETGEKLQLWFSKIFELRDVDHKYLETAAVYDDGELCLDLTFPECYEARKFALSDGENEMEIEMSPLAMIIRSEAAADEILASKALDKNDSATIPMVWAGGAAEREDFSSLDVNLAAYDENRNLLLDGSDVYEISVHKIGLDFKSAEIRAEIYISFNDPIDADAVTSIVWNNYK